MTFLLQPNRNQKKKKLSFLDPNQTLTTEDSFRNAYLTPAPSPCKGSDIQEPAFVPFTTSSCPHAETHTVRNRYFLNCNNIAVFVIVKHIPGFKKFWQDFVTVLSFCWNYLKFKQCFSSSIK